MVYILNYWTCKDLQHYHVLERQFSYSVDGFFRLALQLGENPHLSLYVSTSVCATVYTAQKFHHYFQATEKCSQEGSCSTVGTGWLLVCF